MTQEEKDLIEQAAEKTIQEYLECDTSSFVADHGQPHFYLPHFVKTKINILFYERYRDKEKLLEYKEYAAKRVMEKWEERQKV